MTLKFFEEMFDKLINKLFIRFVNVILLPGENGWSQSFTIIYFMLHFFSFDFERLQ